MDLQKIISKTNQKLNIKKNIIPMNKLEKLDKVDLEILKILQKDARLTIKELAEKVNLSSTPVFERVKRLEREGYIKGYMAILSAEKLNQGFVVFCNVKMTQLNSEIAEKFTRVIHSIAQIRECYNISGGNDYLLKIHVANMDSYKDLVLNVLGKIDYLASLESIFVMDEIKQEYGITL